MPVRRGSLTRALRRHRRQSHMLSVAFAIGVTRLKTEVREPNGDCSGGGERGEIAVHRTQTRAMHQNTTCAF
jgi:hypothetical protein